MGPTTGSTSPLWPLALDLLRAWPLSGPRGGASPRGAPRPQPSYWPSRGFSIQGGVAPSPSPPLRCWLSGAWVCWPFRSGTRGTVAQIHLSRRGTDPPRPGRLSSPAIGHGSRSERCGGPRWTRTTHVKAGVRWCEWRAPSQAQAAADRPTPPRAGYRVATTKATPPMSASPPPRMPQLPGAPCSRIAARLR